MVLLSRDVSCKVLGKNQLAEWRNGPMNINETFQSQMDRNADCAVVVTSLFVFQSINYFPLHLTGYLEI